MSSELLFGEVDDEFLVAAGFVAEGDVGVSALVEEEFGGEPHEAVVVLVLLVAARVLQEHLLQQLWVFEPLDRLQGAVVGRVRPQHQLRGHQPPSSRRVHLREEDVGAGLECLRDGGVFLVVLEYSLYEIEVVLAVVPDEEEGGPAHALLPALLLPELLDLRLVDAEAVYAFLEDLHLEQLPVLLVAEQRL